MKTIKLRKVGNSYGFTVPKELIDKYNLQEGVELHIIEQQDGFILTPYNPELDKWIKAFHNTNQKYKNTLKALSK